MYLIIFAQYQMFFRYPLGIQYHRTQLHFRYSSEVSILSFDTETEYWRPISQSNVSVKFYFMSCYCSTTSTVFLCMCKQLPLVFSNVSWNWGYKLDKKAFCKPYLPILFSHKSCRYTGLKPSREGRGLSWPQFMKMALVVASLSGIDMRVAERARSIIIKVHQKDKDADILWNSHIFPMFQW